VYDSQVVALFLRLGWDFCKLQIALYHHCDRVKVYHHCDKVFDKMGRRNPSYRIYCEKNYVVSIRKCSHKVWMSVHITQ
jgi:hypothetical protein